MVNFKINIDGISKFISREEIKLFENEAISNFKKIVDRTGEGNESLGWVDLPENISANLIAKVNEEANRIVAQSEVIVIAGIGGSYLGARAVIEALSPYFSKNNQKEIIYAGHNISEDYLDSLINWLDNKSYSLIVISKSGTTLETAIAFRLLKTHLEKKYGKDEAKKRITAITDAKKGALKESSNIEGYQTFIIPEDIGGRYSVLTPVGLLPIACAGFNIEKIISGAKNMRKKILESTEVFENPAFLYATIRNILYNKGKVIEILAQYEPKLFYFCEWWKQLFGESEGKKGKGIFPVSVGFTTDLHSLGQYIQEGQRIFFETVISIEKSKNALKIPKLKADFDGLNYIADKNIHDINSIAEKGTSLAHIDGNVPVIKFTLPEINEENIGEMLYFFKFSCALSSYYNDINPFDQPGVEAYKSNIYSLLKKL